MLEANENKSHYIAALLLGVTGLLIILIFVSLRSQADQLSQEGTAETSITDAPAMLGESSLDAGASLVGGTLTLDIAPSNVTGDTNTALTVTVPYTDANSCMQVKERGSFYMRLHPAAVSCASGETNYNTCYEEDSFAGTFSCVDSGCTGEDDTSGEIVCSFPFRHYADSGSWNVDYGIFDEDAMGSYTNTNVYVAETKAISLVDTSLNFGELALGATSTLDNVFTRVRNVGNVGADISVQGTAFTCTKQINAFPVGQLKYASSSGAVYGDKVALTTGAVETGNTLAEQDAETQIRENTEYEKFYWDIQIPSTGVAGTCTSTVTIVGA